MLDQVELGASTEYLNFLNAHPESTTIGDFVLLYGQSDLTERNETYEISSYLSGWVAIGDDGAGSAILMRLNGSSQVYLCGHGALGSVEPEQVADSFVVWFQAGCPADWLEDDDLDEDD